VKAFAESRFTNFTCLQPRRPFGAMDASINYDLLL
jgi:hypothetical protein